MSSSITYQEYKEILKQDKERRYINFIVPAEGEYPEIDLRGKRLDELSIDDAIRAKVYAGRLFDMTDKSTMKQ